MIFRDERVITCFGLSVPEKDDMMSATFLALLLHFWGRRHVRFTAHPPVLPFAFSGAQRAFIFPDIFITAHAVSPSGGGGEALFHLLRNACW